MRIVSPPPALRLQQAAAPQHWERWTAPVQSDLSGDVLIPADCGSGALMRLHPPILPLHIHFVPINYSCTITDPYNSPDTQWVPLDTFVPGTFTPFPHISNPATHPHPPTPRLCDPWSIISNGNVCRGPSAAAALVDNMMISIQMDQWSTSARKKHPKPPSDASVLLDTWNRNHSFHWICGPDHRFGTDRHTYQFLLTMLYIYVIRENCEATATYYKQCTRKGTKPVCLSRPST